jgi:hypothetical protein
MTTAANVRRDARDRPSPHTEGDGHDKNTDDRWLGTQVDGLGP